LAQVQKLGNAKIRKKAEFVGNRPIQFKKGFGNEKCCKHGGQSSKYHF